MTYPNASPVRVIAVKKRWNHHAQFSGYDRLADFLDPVAVVKRPQLSGPAELASKIWDRYASPRYVFDYHLGDRLAEELAFWWAITKRADIVHVLYADEQLDILLRRANLLPSHLVATFHFPASHYEQRFESLQRDELRRLSGVVVLASQDVPGFAKWLGPEKVMFAPHGIDVSAFPVGEGNRSEALRLVFVGLNMRDFEVAHSVADQCVADGIDVFIDVVLPQERFAFFTGCSNVKRHSNISDSTLIELYRGADALFLPVTGGTANNAILEALACGTPVISTRIGGIADYVDDSCGWLLPPANVAAAFECVRVLAKNRDLARLKRAGARARAEKLRWERSAAQIRAGYSRLVAGGPFAEHALRGVS